MTTALATPTVPRLATRGAVLCWHELPRSLAAGGGWLAAGAAPHRGVRGRRAGLAARGRDRAGRARLTGLAVRGPVARGDGRGGSLRRADPVLALVLAGGVGSPASADRRRAGRAPGRARGRLLLVAPCPRLRRPEGPARPRGTTRRRDPGRVPARLGVRAGRPPAPAGSSRSRPPGSSRSWCCRGCCRSRRR